jgi:hypothetical protein
MIRKDNLKFTSNSYQKSMTVEKNIILYEGNIKTGHIKSPIIEIKIKFIKQFFEGTTRMEITD